MSRQWEWMFSKCGEVGLSITLERPVPDGTRMA